MGRLCGIVYVLVSSTLVGSARPASAQSSPLKEVTDLLAMQYQAISAADTTVLGPLWAPQLVWVLGPTGSSVTRSQLMAAVSRPQSPRPRFEVDQVQIRQAGTAVIVDYRRRDTRQVAGYQMATVSRVVDVFAGPPKRRQLVAHSQTWLVSPASSWLADSAALHPFVGRYQIAPDYIDNVHWEGGQLVATASGQTAGAVLVPVSGSAFRPDGVGALIVFERDPVGRVTGYVQGFPDGQVVRAVRLR